MFSSDLRYNFQTPEKAKEAVAKLNEKVKAAEGYSIEIIAEECSVVAKIKAQTSELLRIAMNVVFPEVEAIEPEARVQ